MGQTTRNPNGQLAFAWDGQGEARSSPGKGSSVETAPPRQATLPHNLMEQVVTPTNMRRALRRVWANGGSPGGDGMTVAELPGFLQQAWPQVRQTLLSGEYQPQPVRRVEIPKPDGGVRLLGIPAVVDRLIQQAILQVLEPLYDPTFSPHSYGFRPGKSAHQAVRQACEFVAAGKAWVVDLDLEKFFDRVNHDLLMSRLARKLGDRRLLRLIRRFLTAGVLVHGVVIERHEGTPQGGPLSPLLSNILLDELDRELTKRGLSFCRYADDCNIYVQSRKAGERVMASVIRFLERRLRLKVNLAKSAVAAPQERKFLGFRLLPPNQWRAEPLIRLAPQSLKRLKHKLRCLTGRHRGVSREELLRELGRYTQGWMSYYALAGPPSVYRDLDSWLRRRLRAFIWTQWKTPKNRSQHLRQSGVPHFAAMSVAYNRMGAWRAAGNGNLNRAVNNQRLREWGFQSLLDSYMARHNASGKAVSSA
jgi:RNA-directed DNA polymerase